MPTPPHRTPEMKARHVAHKHVRSQEDLDKLLRQFSRDRRARILERLRPHLEFEPAALPAFDSQAK